MMRQGRQYRFCGRKCLDQFEREQAGYVSGGHQSEEGIAR